MKKIIVLILITLSPQLSHALERVQYFQDSIYTFTNDTVSFLSGSTWEVSGTNYFPLGNALIILDQYRKNDQSYDVIYLNGSSYLAFHDSGYYTKDTGLFGVVGSRSDNGSKLILQSGEVITLLNTSNTYRWRPPYNVLISSDLNSLWNLEGSEKVNILSID